MAALQDGIHAGLVSRQTDALKLTRFPDPEGPVQWGVAAQDGPSVVALENGCFLVSWNHFADFESPLFSRRLCDNARDIEIHPLHRCGIGGDRAISSFGRLRTATMDGEQVAFAMDALDPTVGAQRVRLSLVPKPNEL